MRRIYACLASPPSKTKAKRTSEKGKRELTKRYEANRQEASSKAKEAVSASSFSSAPAASQYALEVTESAAIQEGKINGEGCNVSLLPDKLPLATRNFHVLYPISDDERCKGTTGADGAEATASCATATSDVVKSALRRARIAQIVAATEKLGLGIFYKEHRRMSTSSIKE